MIAKRLIRARKILVRMEGRAKSEITTHSPASASRDILETVAKKSSGAKKTETLFAEMRNVDLTKEGALLSAIAEMIRFSIQRKSDAKKWTHV
ncbi:hypothetical protein TNCV_4282071 [Trichonephila clavipes]|nr:hypothetical protein TNCV_4282071 [Trichonephila clavipes]